VGNIVSLSKFDDKTKSVKKVCDYLNIPRFYKTKWVENCMLLVPSFYLWLFRFRRPCFRREAIRKHDFPTNIFIYIEKQQKKNTNKTAKELCILAEIKTTLTCPSHFYCLKSVAFFYHDCSLKISSLGSAYLATRSSKDCRESSHSLSCDA
jgi:hypothetical protein